jgi:Protein of unknown function (DUF1549).
MIWNKKSKHLLVAGTAILAGSSFFLSRADDPADKEQMLPVEHPECVFFGPKHDSFVQTGLAGSKTPNTTLSILTQDVASQLPEVSSDAGGPVSAPGGSRTNVYQRSSGKNSIDKYLFAAMADAGVKPAGKTTDFEFIRRVTLDLTGRIPTAERVLTFISDASPDKRSKLVDELLAKPEWTDKWTMYFGDLFNNTTVNTQSGVQRYGKGEMLSITGLRIRSPAGARTTRSHPT